MIKRKDLLFLGITEQAIHDIVPFIEEWINGFFFNAWDNSLSNKNNLANIPFSHSKLFLIKIFIEYLRGKNSIFLMTSH